jgi:3-hexulose-6-phosphate synthase/6-phospho-3-hexuloisomerase
MERLGVDVVVHHIGFDERGMITGLSPLDEIDAVVSAVSAPVQAVGGLSIQQAIECATRGAPLVVVGAPLVIDGAAFRPASSDLLPVLQRICGDVHKIPLRPVRGGRAPARQALTERDRT